jgi:hypothetical protein
MFIASLVEDSPLSPGLRLRLNSSRDIRSSCLTCEGLGANVTVDGKAVPALHAVDVSLGAGKVGIGSFESPLHVYADLRGNCQGLATDPDLFTEEKKNPAVL